MRPGSKSKLAVFHISSHYPLTALVNAYNTYLFCNDYDDDDHDDDYDYDYDEEEATMSAANVKTAVFSARFLLSNCRLFAGPSVPATNTSLNSDSLPQPYAIPGTRWKSSS